MSILLKIYYGILLLQGGRLKPMCIKNKGQIELGCNTFTPASGRAGLNLEKL